MLHRNFGRRAATLMACFPCAACAFGQECRFERLSSMRVGEAAFFHPDSIEREGELLYTTMTSPELLRIFDVSAPAAPRLLSTSGLAGAKGVAVAGSLVVLSSNRNIATIDAADPAAPRRLDTLATRGEGLGVIIDGPVAFVADGDGGVMAVDISDPTDLRELDVLDTPGRAIRVAVHNGVAYVADREGGVRIIDVRDPSRMTEVASLTQWRVNGVAVEGSLLAVATDRDGVALVDVREPAAPVTVGMIDTRLPALTVALIDSVAWISAGAVTGDGELLGVDIRDPAAPIEFGRVAFPSPFGFKGSYALDFAVSGYDAHVPVYLYDSFRVSEIELHALDLSPCTPCPADCDGSGALDFFDFLCFQNLFAAGSLRADCDGDGELTVFDFLCFQNEFAAGCW